MAKHREVSPSDDIINSRDLLAHIAALESEREDLEAAVLEAEEQYKNTPPHEDRSSAPIEDAKLALAEWVDGDDCGILLAALIAFRDEAENVSGEGLRYGATLIRDSYFEDHARDEAESMGSRGEFDTWPHTCIDWEKAAEELQYDYSSCEFDGVMYWVRS